MTNDVIHDIDHAAPLEIVDRPVPLARRLYGNPSLRRLGVVVLLGLIWQAYGVVLDNPLLFPRLSDTLVALFEGLMSGEIPKKVLISLRVLLIGYGLGWYIFENKNELEIANVFAGLLTVIAIGLIVDSLVFGQIEKHTLRRWGMQAH